MAKKNKLEKIKPNNLEVTEYDFIICPNCGAEEVGKFCPNCGQSNKDFNKPLKEIVGELLDSINLDIRLLNTLIPFFTKPGFLTREYFNGRRKRYVPPMRLYMFFSILFFFLVQYVDVEDNHGEDKNPISEPKNSIMSFSLSNSETDSLEFGVDPITNSSENLITGLSASDREKIISEVSIDSTTPETLKEIIIGGMNANDKKEMFKDKFLKYLSYVLFVLMPFFALTLMMILWKSKKLYVHHLIFSINFHTFIFGLSSVIIILGEILPDFISGYIIYLWWGIPLYLLIGIKRFYNRKLIGSFFKTFGALMMYSLTIGIVLIAILAYVAKEFYI
ncbi:MAG: DUF3667 domain-containing protein [Bacteroidales bacterium]|nr:DUF3667 domain-containing protein [Bacteroidales bacterium]